MNHRGSRLVIIVGFASILLLLLGLMLVSLNTISTTNARLRTMVREQNDVTHIFTMRDAAHTRALLLYQMASIEDRFEQDALYEEFISKAEDFLKARDAMLGNMEDRQQLDIWEQAAPIVARSNRYANEAIDYILKNQREKAQDILLNEVGPSQSEAMVGLTTLFENQRKAIEAELANATASAQTSYLLIGALGSLAMLMGLAIAFYVTRHNEKYERDILAQKEIAVRANHSKSAFLANISHEMRTPLTAIIGFSESLLDDKQTFTERHESIQTVNRAGKHLLQIINDLLDLSKVEADKVDYEQVPVSIFNLIDDITSLAVIQSDAKGIDFDINYVYPLPTHIYSDPVRLKQVLLNLVTNAIKFTEHGSVTLRVAHDAGANKLVFTVLDTGIGMGPEEIDRLFKPFSQGDASTTRQYGGTGLGLYLSKALATNLGGDITVRSERNMGSIFTCTIDTGDLSDVEYVYTAKAMDKQLETTPYQEVGMLKGKVLLVEDNADNQKLISLYLTKLGAEVSVAANGQEAMDATSQREFDLILMDMQMPVMDGLEATRLLRQHGYRRPIVALTAGAMQDDILRTQKAGCDAFLSKPIDRNQFNTVVAHYLNRPGDSDADNAPIGSNLVAEEPEMYTLVLGVVTRLPEMVSKLDLLLASQDWDSLKRNIHDLKGLGGSYGYPQITRLAARMESDLLKQHYTEIPQLIKELHSLVRRIGAGLQSPTAIGTRA